MTNEQDFDSMKLMETIQAIFTVLIWRTQWVKAKKMALPKSVMQWSLRTLRVKLIKIDAKVVKHARYVTFQMAEVLVSKRLFQEILERIHRLKPVPIIPRAG